MTRRAKWFVYAPLFAIILLLGTCVVEVNLGKRTVKEYLFGRYVDTVQIIDEKYEDLYFFGDDTYRFYIDTSVVEIKDRPDNLVMTDSLGKKEDIIDVFHNQFPETKASLSLGDGVSVYLADVIIEGTVCKSFPCALYWVEDKKNKKLFVSLNSF